MSHQQAPSYGVVVPVKPPAFAKSRLAALGDAVRQDLCAAFAMDTITAVVECRLVHSVLVVTDDALFASGLAGLGVRVIPDGVADNLNASLELGAAELLRHEPGLRLAAVFADLPALRPDELTTALLAADGEGLSFVADAANTGTTTVVAPSLETFTPRFGVDSRQAHLQLGGHEILADVPGLRHDIDTPADLAAALRLGVGPRTSFVATAHAL
jgi:2-phospho-L-lactate/phosphoenolpyruvate guanylyltransferase